MKRNPRSAPLEAHALDQCARCGARVWTYATHGGVLVSVDAAPGSVVIDGLGKAFFTPDGDGYREHDCQYATHHAFREVGDDDFLWP